MRKAIGAAEFKAMCLKLIDQVGRDGEPITITKRGRPVAVLSAIRERIAPASIIGALAGTVQRYDDPFAPAADAAEWDASR